MTKKSSLLTSSVPPTIIDKGDSAPSSHYLCEEDKQCLKNIKPFHGPPTLLPDNSTITADKKVILPLSEELSPEAQTTMMLPNLKSASLILIGQLCDNNCYVILNKDRLITIHNKKVQGMRNRCDNLWDITVQK